MAVAPTGLIFKTLQFDGQSSGEYGVYITGKAVYNAPARDIEMVSIPGRLGAFALDHGRFENIEVTYPAGIFADNEAGFAEAISDFRNYLCSRNGYVRLTDDYNPEEFRMAIYKSGLEVSPAQLKAGEFEITFDCKPQRWLMSGEAAIEVESGTTLLNPTMFDASPLLEVEGYGTIEFNGYEIELENVLIGEVPISDARTMTDFKTRETFPYESGAFDASDEITIAGMRWSWDVNTKSPYSFVSDSVSLAYDATSELTDATLSHSQTSSKATFEIVFPDLVFVAGTQYTMRYKMDADFTYNTGSQNVSMHFDLAFYITNYTDGRIYFACNLASIGSSGGYIEGLSRLEFQSITGDSTLTALGHPTYIDCDLGEAYMIKNDSYVSLNRYIDLGSKLPLLVVGGSEITFDNTITDLKVRPRWWKV